MGGGENVEEGVALDYFQFLCQRQQHRAKLKPVGGKPFGLHVHFSTFSFCSDLPPLLGSHRLI